MPSYICSDNLGIEWNKDHQAFDGLCSLAPNSHLQMKHMACYHRFDIVEQM